MNLQDLIQALASQVLTKEREAETKDIKIVISIIQDARVELRQIIYNPEKKELIFRCS